MIEMRILLALAAALSAAPAIAGAQPKAPTGNPVARQPITPQPLPRAKFIADMDNHFRGMDANGDQVVSAAEARTAQQRQATEAARASARAAFRELDSDKNGQLSQAEFERLGTAYRAALPPPPTLSFDANKDGRVTLVEYRVGTQANFDRLDADRDGEVSAAEMQRGGLIR